MAPPRVVIEETLDLCFDAAQRERKLAAAKKVPNLRVRTRETTDRGPIDFIFNEDRTRVECRACSVGFPAEHRTSIAIRSAAKHLESPDHLKPLRGPIAAGASHGRSVEEIDMWDKYKTCGANFNAGEDEMDVGVEHKRLHKLADVFGLMTAEAVARKLGFGTGDVGEDILGDKEEEDFLSEIMGKAALQEPDQADIQSDGQPNTQSSYEWFPYSTKMTACKRLQATQRRLPSSHKALKVTRKESQADARNASLEVPQ
ncbi:hypothetical protein B0H19DRAFT_1083078 [Mycena capillaripes]|nr:hypothetical protein B0H19DRAFT_1083078 [Mycena capillaripes]